MSDNRRDPEEPLTMAAAETNPRFQAILATAAHLLGSNIAHYGFEQGANDKALAKAVEFALKLVDRVNETVLDRARPRE
jgi:hypothetical protein